MPATAIHEPLRKPGVIIGPRWRARGLPPAELPVKHKRYPVPEVQPVTIAAGFRCADGVVIGADTRIEEGNVKYEENKVFECHDATARAGVFLAGAGDFESISHCAELLRLYGFHGSTGNISGLKNRLHAFTETKRYRRLIERTPPSGDFAAIIAISSDVGETDLLYLSGENLYPVPEYKCIGAGSETAMFIAKWLYQSAFSIRSFMPIAVQIFRAAKFHNAGCDDSTKIIRLYNAGVDLEHASGTLWGDAEYLWGLHNLLGFLIRGCFDGVTSQDRFDVLLRDLEKKFRSIRASAMIPEGLPAYVKEHLQSLRTRAPADPQSTTADSSRQPPSQE